MKYTLAGFPYIKTPMEYLCAVFDKDGYGNNRIGVHCEKDRKTSHLHELTWLLINEGYIIHDVDRVNDGLFKVRLTMKGVETVERFKEGRRRNCYTILSIIGSFMAAVFAILSFLSKT